MNQQLNCIGELVFAALTARDAAQRIEDGAIEQVTSDCNEVGWSIRRVRLFHHALDSLHIVPGISVGRVSTELTRLRRGGVLNIEDTVVVDLFMRNFQRTQHRTTKALAHFRHPIHHAHWEHEIVGKHDSNAVLIVFEQRLCDQHRMPQAQRSILDNGFDADNLGGAAYLRCNFVLAALGESLLKVRARVEVPKHAVLTRRCDNSQALRTSGGGLFSNHLDARRINYGQQFFRHCLGGRQESRTHARGRNDDSSNRSSHVRTRLFRR